jgi:hypothetical protein
MASELGPVEREAALAALRKRVRKAGRGGDRSEFDRLSAEYAELKEKHVNASHREMKAAMRARRAAERAEGPVEEPKRWRLPYGFSSPLAAERARSGVRPREEPAGPPPGGLRPWRRGSLMSERIWRP